MKTANSLSEKVEIFQNLLIATATGGSSDDAEYRRLRSELLANPLLRDRLPRFVRTCRESYQFWQFIKYEYRTYHERREYLWGEFRPILEMLDKCGPAPADPIVSGSLEKFDSDSVHHAWSKAVERRATDPEGAITAARTLLESVCKRILDERATPYDPDSDLPGLFRLTAKELNLAPSQHSETVFKQILGGCTAVVEGLGALRNRLSDAHGQGKRPVRPAARHAELAVNLAGAMATFLVATWEARNPATQS